MIETHPFVNFVPKKVKYLMLGSFVTKPSNPYEWFYANGRNQFWPIMAEVYGLDFSTKAKQQQLFIQLEMALADIILLHFANTPPDKAGMKRTQQTCHALAGIPHLKRSGGWGSLSCERKKNSNLDINLYNCVYNTTAITTIIKENKVRKIFFTSRYVETLFRRNFKDIVQLNAEVELICLPSPSPRFAMLNKQEKVKRYKELLPKPGKKL